MTLSIARGRSGTIRLTRTIGSATARADADVVMLSSSGALDPRRPAAYSRRVTAPRGLTSRGAHAIPRRASAPVARRLHPTSSRGGSIHADPLDRRHRAHRRRAVDPAGRGPAEVEG